MEKITWQHLIDAQNILKYWAVRNLGEWADDALSEGAATCLGREFRGEAQLAKLLQLHARAARRRLAGCPAVRDLPDFVDENTPVTLLEGADDAATDAARWAKVAAAIRFLDPAGRAACQAIMAGASLAGAADAAGMTQVQVQRLLCRLARAAGGVRQTPQRRRRDAGPQLSLLGVA